MEQTLTFIKPDAVEKNQIGNIIALYEDNDLKVIATKMVRLTEKRAQEFYAVHKEKPFYDDLVEYVCSGPILALVLEGDNAVTTTRKVMGATDPLKAEKGTIRNLYGTSLDINAVHGSDSIENAKKEIVFFFEKYEIMSY